MSSIKCLIFERDAGGHRLHHVRHLAEALLNVGCRVVVVLQSDVKSRVEYKVHLQPLEPHIELRTNLNPRQESDYFSLAARVTELVEAISFERPDWAYIPYSDMLTQAAAIRSVLRGGGELRATPIEGQVMRGRFAYPESSRLGHLGSFARRWLTQRSPWRVTHILDPWVYENLKRTASTTEFRQIPEPVEPLPQVDRTDARRHLGIPTTGRYVAIAGLLAPHKGIDLLLAAFARAKLQADSRLLLVGQMHDAIRELIARDYSGLVRAGRLCVIDRYVTDFEIGCCFMAGDVLVVPHPRQVGSSGTLGRAVAAERPLISSDYGWVGCATERFELGTAVNVADPQAFAAAIEAALDGAQHWRPSEKAIRYCQYNTLKNQQAHWLASLGRELGVPLGQYEDRIEWSWVADRSL